MEKEGTSMRHVEKNDSNYYAAETDKVLAQTTQSTEQPRSVWL
jgi:hypothetical protein